MTPVAWSFFSIFLCKKVQTRSFRQLYWNQSHVLSCRYYMKYDKRKIPLTAMSYYMIKIIAAIKTIQNASHFQLE